MKRLGGSSRSLAEWITLGLSVLIVGALVAVALIEESRRDEESGANLMVTFETDGANYDGEWYYVPYTVLNTGADAISAADVWIEVYDGQKQVESAEITVQFLPLQGKQHGIYVSAYDPATHDFRARLESLQFP
jgi:uncharacterized protein (TIGR02588 family)